MYVCMYVCIALDLQSCGLTSDVAKLFSNILSNNKTLMVLDLRENDLIGKHDTEKYDA